MTVWLSDMDTIQKKDPIVEVVRVRIYCMSDIHGCLAEFEEALSLVVEYLEEPETMLILMGDYIHGGADRTRRFRQDNETTETVWFGKSTCIDGEPRRVCFVGGILLLII